MRARGRLDVNFQALDKRFCSTTCSRPGSHKTTTSSANTKMILRYGANACSSTAISWAMTLKFIVGSVEVRSAVRHPLLEFFVEPQILHCDASAVGQSLQQFLFLRRRVMQLGPVVTDGAARRRRTDRHHGETLNEGVTVSVGRNARIGVDIFD